VTRAVRGGALLLSLAANAEAQTRGAEDADLVRMDQISRIAHRLAAADSFSGAVLVGRGDQIIFQSAMGRANRERGEPLRLETRFALASITKTFVTTAIATLVDKGKLSWEDSLGHFFPDFPLAQARAHVRIKHLLTHTSGLRELDAAPQRPRSLDDYVRMVVQAQQGALLHEPGSRAVYNNGNYVLLGRIIELASGRPFHEYIRERIFEPARMTETGFDLPGRAPVPLAVAYDRRVTSQGVQLTGDNRATAPTVDYPPPYTGAHSTVRDLFRFARALRSGRIVRKETAELLLSPKPEAGNWGYGFDILDEQRGVVGHGGSWIGMSNSLDMFTRSGYTVVILSNYSRGRSPLRESIRAILP
jgi:CubicO group peptidase (beta-lactamase class C family)